MEETSSPSRIAMADTGPFCIHPTSPPAAGIGGRDRGRGGGGDITSCIAMLDTAFLHAPHQPAGAGIGVSDGGGGGEGGDIARRIAIADTA